MTQIPFIEIDSYRVGAGHPCFVIAEIGINHNGDLETAKRLIDASVAAGCDAVKFQKRTPELCVPEAQKGLERNTPWGRITYLDYRYKVEFEQSDYAEIDAYCREQGILWTASCWDEPSLAFVDRFAPAFHKVASAMLTNDDLLRAYKACARPLLVSTGMSSMDEIRHAAEVLGDDLPWMFLHCTSTYPAKTDEINLRMMDTLRQEFGRPVGYSGHEVGLQISLAAAALGADALERHITLDRAMWGSDQAASVEPPGFARLVRDIRVVEAAMGDGVKRVYDSELPVRAKLRWSH
ncbi:MAG: N-acetylneuraminate synthase family protein [Anaerolineales bacterium]|nr:N-acetylneuraminate synthase family protein [Anaerolineales bacterium]MCB8989448.1 N-acetylneuraminate synthase family protein [Ardenticatenaceae bacterium]MCB9005014.1 N-acetylneuraminate synthase family protein [Ardenticatenaceae bacterium]